MKAKGLEWLILIPMLIVSFSIINTVAAPETLATVYIDPSEISAEYGEIFVINVNIKDVVDLYAYDVRIRWPHDLLVCLDVTEGPFMKSQPSSLFLPKIYVDYIIVACTTFGSVPGVSGSGTLFTVTFEVMDAGKCTLEIYQSTLLDSSLAEMSHSTEDGYFYTMAEVDLVRRSAWPEHHHYVVSKDEDVYQSLYGKVKNLGSVSLKVYVEFNLVRDDGKVYIAQSGTVVVSSGEIIDLPAMFGPLTDIDVGKYAVNASCWYSYTGNYWAQGDKAKTFSFAVVL